MPESNPLLSDWHTPFETPPFDAIRVEHFQPAFAAALKLHDEEVATITGDTAAPSFVNTIDALERSGRQLRAIESIFWVLAGADTSDALQAVEREIAPVLAGHHNRIASDPQLFARVDALHAYRDELDLSAEQKRVLDLIHRRLVRSGARLDTEDRKRLGEIVQRLAALGTQFSQNVLADEKSFTLALDSAEDRAGLPPEVVEAAARAATDRGLPGHYIITLGRSSVEPFLQFSARRDLREKVFRAWTNRGAGGGATDNHAIIRETLRLRAERARLLGFATYAHYKLDDTMAKSPDAVRELLDEVWTRARAKAGAERDALQAMAGESGDNFPLAAHDWRFYAEKLRKAQHDFDEAEIKPYLDLENVIAAAFYTAERLFGVNFIERHDIPKYHPDVRTFEMRDAAGEHIALFFGDYFARPSKRSGAWMTSLRGQQKLAGDVTPIIINVMNFSRGADNKPSLVGFDEARTLFHEFGHALHGMLSNVTYPTLAGTRVARDFVEFPSQLYEHWFMQPQILERFARHVESGEPMPLALRDKVLAAANFDQGFATVEYSASAIVDLDFHTTEVGDDFDAAKFEAAVLERIGMPEEIAMRHRTPHFTHVFSGEGYSAGYYSYLWSEVLDADGFRAFEERGDIFEPEVAARLRDYVYSAGALREPEEAYKMFRGQMPTLDALLEGRGLK